MGSSQIDIELRQATEELNKFRISANSNRDAWTDAQWDHLSELFNAISLTLYAVQNMHLDRGKTAGARPMPL